MIWTIFTLLLCAGLLWLPYYLDIGAQWFQYSGVIIAMISGVFTIVLGIDWTAHEIMRVRKLHYQATEGVKLSYAVSFIHALRGLPGSSIKELFDVSILMARGLPGWPIVWRVEFPGGMVGLSVLEDFLSACCEIYDDKETVHELWPIRDHNRNRFGPDAEHELSIITWWLVDNGYAVKPTGNRAATWKDGVHPLDVIRGLGLEEPEIE